MFRNLKLQIILFTLIRQELTRGSFESTRYEAGDGLTKSLTEPFCIAALQQFDFSKCYFYNTENQSNPRVWARVRRVAFRTDTHSSQAIAILEFAVIKANGKYDMLYFFICMDNCSVAARKYTLNTKQVPEQSYDKLSKCWKAVNEFERTEKWPSPKAFEKNVRSPIEITDIVANVVVYTVFGAFVVVIGGLFTAACALGAPVTIGVIICKAYKASTGHLSKKGFVQFEVEFADSDKEHGIETTEASALQVQSGAQSNIKPAVTSEHGDPERLIIAESVEKAKKNSKEGEKEPLLASDRDVTPGKIEPTSDDEKQIGGGGNTVKPRCKKKVVSVVKPKPKTES